MGPPQAGSILEYWPAAGGLDFGELSSGPAAGGLDFGELSSVARRRRARFWSIGPLQAGSISERWQVWPAAGGLEFRVWARRRRARFLRGGRCGPPQAGSILEYWPAAGSQPQAGQYSLPAAEWLHS